MTSRGSHQVTLKVDSIFVKPSGKKGVKPKKILLPSSIVALKKVAKAALKEPLDITAFFDENGVQINDISNINPGATLTYTTSEAQTLKKPKKSTGPKVFGMAPTIQTSQTIPEEQQEPVPQMPIEEAAQEVPQPPHPEEEQPIEVVQVPQQDALSTHSRKSISSAVSKESSLSKASSPSTASRSKSLIPKPRAGTPMNSKSHIEDFLVGAEEEEAQTDMVSVSSTLDGTQSATQSATNAGSESESYDTVEGEEPKHFLQEVEAPEIDDEEEEESKEEEEEVPIQESEAEKIIRLAFPQGTPSDEVCAGMDMLNQDSREFLEGVLSLEDQQKQDWYKRMKDLLANQGFLQTQEGFSHTNEINELACKFISSHRIDCQIGSSYLFKSVIVGPRGSGKSSILGAFTDCLLTDVIATDNWKSTFIFAVDMRVLLSQISDMALFYKTLINIIFDLIKAQRPSLSPFIPAIEKSFESVVEKGVSASVPKRFLQGEQNKKAMHELQRIITHLASLWFTPTAMFVWLTNIMLLPRHISQAFGFSQVIYIFDNFEAAEQELYPIYPFEESESVSFLVEYWKFAICDSPFILSSTDTASLASSLSPLDELGVDLGTVVEYIQTTNIIEHPHYSDFEFIAEMSDENKTQVKFSIDVCGGSPAFLSLWYSVNSRYDDYEKIREGSEDKEDAYFSVMTSAENLLRRVLVSFASPSEGYDASSAFAISEIRRRKL